MCPHTRTQITRADSFFSLMSAFTRALNHSLRTPLSIISNDLFVFRGLLPPDETSRSEQRCKQISNILHELTILGGEDLITAPCVLGALLNDLGFNNQCQEELLIEADTTRLQFALQQVLSLISPEERQKTTWTLSKEETTITLAWELNPNYHIDSSMVESSLTYYIHRFQDKDALMPVLADCILMAHEIQITISDNPAKKIELTFPNKPL